MLLFKVSFAFAALLSLLLFIGLLVLGAVVADTLPWLGI